LKRDHYNWRDFKVHFVTEKGKHYAEFIIDEIMNMLLGKGIIGFTVTDLKKEKNQEFKDHIDRWLVRSVLNPKAHCYSKYPKTTGWGTHINGVYAPIDWKVRGLCE